ncbi:GGDEF domain-containing protein, partial [Candidatus Falkowbacteria bacterium]|nr:GGDEF domain-containing protein [Candidatus Falkowbacteria bacterium]
YGHRSGDKTLRKLGEVLLGKDMFRSEDLCFRYGGDEFGVFVPIKTNSQKIDDLDDPEEANLVMRRIEEIMARVKSNLEQTAMSGGDKKDITFSAGITFGSADDLAHITTLKKTADQALYAAKEGGRSSYAIQRELQVAHKDDQASADTENKPIVLVRRVDELTTNEELKQLF